jgi:hypothetical protein
MMADIGPEFNSAYSRLSIFDFLAARRLELLAFQISTFDSPLALQDAAFLLRRPTRYPRVAPPAATIAALSNGLRLALTVMERIALEATALPVLPACLTLSAAFFTCAALLCAVFIAFVRVLLVGMALSLMVFCFGRLGSCLKS